MDRTNARIVDDEREGVEPHHSVLQASMEDLHGEVEVIRGGWERLTESYIGVTERVSSVEKRLDSIHTSMTSMSQILARIEANQSKEKALGKQKASSSSSPIQVHILDSEQEPVANAVGYRGINSILENRNGMLKKIELPVFDGNRPYGWITQAERFFRLGNYNDFDRLDLMSVSLQGPVLNWYNREIARAPFQSWPQFKKRMIARFSQKLNENPRNRLFSMKQTGSVVDFVNEFEELSTVVPGVDEENLVHVFYLGLKPEMQEVIKIKEPLTLTDHFNAVMRMEDSIFCSSMASTNQVTQPKRSTYVPVKTVQYTNYRGPTNQVTGDTSKEFRHSNDSGKDKQPWRSQHSGQVSARLSPAEMAELRKRGLCYKCKGTWSRTHECQNIDLKVFTVLNGCEVEVIDEEWAVFYDEEVDTVNEVVELSLLSMMGLPSFSTTKLWGYIGKVRIVVMLDSGATHNFINPTVVTKAKLKSIINKDMTIRLGTGITTTGSSICQQIPFALQGLEFTADFIVLDLGDTDIILGIQWLRTLGNCGMNWDTHELSFLYKGSMVSLLGDSMLVNTGNSFQSHQQTMAYNSELFQLDMKKEASQIPLILQNLLDRYETIFEEPTQLPPLRGHEHSINLIAGAGPISVRSYRYPQAYKEEMLKQVSTMMAAGIIRHSRSPYSSPVLLVKKKDDSWRFCIDYRALNKATVLDKFPIPMIDQLLDELHGAKYFSKLDLRSGYHQIRMEERDIEKTAFRTAEGHYEFLVMPFGLTNAPATFQALMNDLFRSYLGRFVLVFFDDILVYSSTLEQHEQHLQCVLEIFVKQKLLANKKKCSFGQLQVEYLGHIISQSGVATDPSKTAAMKNWPIPNNVKELRGFLGLTGYYRKFVKGYGVIARPLTELLRKDMFEWSMKAQNAFDQLKMAMSSTPVLALPDFTEMFVVESDASGYGIGAVLMQRQKPIAYFSSGLSPREQLKPIYERELMAVVLAVQKWRHYLLGRKFVVHTDQKSLKFLLEQKEVSLDYQRWLTKLLGYHFDIVYKQGVENKAADGLSRIVSGVNHCTSATLNALTIPTSLELQDLLKEIESDEMIQTLKRKVTQGLVVKDGYKITDDGKLLYKGRLLISRNSEYIPMIFKEFHDSLEGGHSGVLKTVKRIQRVFYWKHMVKDIQKYVSQCDICQRHKYSTLSPAGLLQPLQIPDQIWEGLSMDFIEGLPVSCGTNVILVVVDRLSKFAHFLRLKHPFTAQDVAEKFLTEVVRLHGFPSSIVSDRDRIFLSTFWKELFKQAGTKLKYSTAFHPQSDGQTEVLNRCLETYLRCFASAHPKLWAKFLPWAELWYNTSYHTALGTTPFQVVYGRQPPVLLKFEEGSTTNFELEALLKERDSMLSQIKEQLLRAQERMKNNADKHRRELEFKEGDLVFLKLRPYRQQSVTKRLYQKLAARYYGPFEVVAKVGVVAYRLKLPEESRVHPVFHVSQLKPVLGSGHVTSPLPQSFSVNEELIVEPSSVLDTRYSRDGHLEALISWTNLPEHENSWERVAVLNRQFPNFKLEDKLGFAGGGIDRPVRVYTRKEKTLDGREGSLVKGK